MIDKHLKHFSVYYSLGLAFLTAVSVGPALWVKRSVGIDEVKRSQPLTDNFICKADTFNVARMTEYISLATSLNQEAEAIRSRFLNISRSALQEKLKAQHPRELMEDPETGAITAMWGRPDPQTPPYLILDRIGGPAYLQIDLGAGTYKELWIKDGVFSPQQGRPSSIEVTPDGISQRWLENDNYSNHSGPAIVVLSTMKQTLDMSWYKNGRPAYIGGHPTRIQMDLVTGIVFHEEYGAGDGPDRRMIHRPSDHMNILDRDRKTGEIIHAFYMYHSSDPRSDEITREIFFDPQTGLLQSDVWKKNDLAIARPSIIPIMR